MRFQFRGGIGRSIDAKQRRKSREDLLMRILQLAEVPFGIVGLDALHRIALLLNFGELLCLVEFVSLLYRLISKATRIFI